MSAMRTSLVLGLALWLAQTGCSTAPPDALSSCEETAGRTESISIPGNDNPFLSEAIVHLPPCYDDIQQPLASVYLLHGAGLGPSSFIDTSVDADGVADRLALDGTIQPIVIIAPPRGTAGEAFVDAVWDTLMPEIEAAYNVATNPESRAVAGFSAGGPSAAYVAFTGDPRVAAVGLFASVWSEGLADSVVAGLLERDDRPAVRIDVGDRDGFRNSVPRIEEALAEVDIVPESTIVPGGHDLAFVTERMPVWLEWMDQHLEPRPQS